MSSVLPFSLNNCFLLFAAGNQTNKPEESRKKVSPRIVAKASSKY